jgi:hypothetical protein
LSEPPSPHESGATAPAEAIPGGWSFKEARDALVSLLGVLYIPGLIVTALHHFPYGIYSLDLLRIHYLLVGVWILLPPTLVAAVIVLMILLYNATKDAEEEAERLSRQSKILSSLAKNRRRPSWRTGDQARVPSTIWVRVKAVGRWLAAVGMALSAIPITFYLLSYVVTALGGSMGAADIAHDALVEAFLIVPRWLIFVVAMLFASGILGGLIPLDAFAGILESSLRRPALILPLISLFALLAVTAYLVDFSRSVYPSIPMTLGGGRPVIARVLIEDKARNSFSFLSKEGTDSRPPQSLRAELLLETSQGYLVRVSETPPRALFIPRSKVDGIVLEGNVPSTTTAPWWSRLWPRLWTEEKKQKEEE